MAFGRAWLNVKGDFRMRNYVQNNSRLSVFIDIYGGYLSILHLLAMKLLIKLQYRSVCSIVECEPMCAHCTSHMSSIFIQLRDVS